MSTYEIRPTKRGADQESAETALSLPGSAEDRSVPTEPTAWFRDAVQEITDYWDALGIEVCRHVSDGVIGVLTLRDPSLTCSACAPTRVDDGTCDRCGASGGTQEMVIETILHRPAHRLGDVRFLVGCRLCPPCLELEVGPDE